MLFGRAEKKRRKEGLFPGMDQRAVRLVCFRWTQRGGSDSKKKHKTTVGEEPNKRFLHKSRSPVLVGKGGLNRRALDSGPSSPPFK
jgi:hypothetical protein